MSADSGKHRLRHLFVALSRERVEHTLRTLRPLQKRYLLDEASKYAHMEFSADLEGNVLCPAVGRKLQLSPDEHFVHSSVHQWIRDNSLEVVTEPFCKMGIYTHEDIVNVACRMRQCYQFHRDLHQGLDIDPLGWISAKRALMRYARPVDYTFVKASKVSLHLEARNESLFKDAEWENVMREATEEADQLERRLEQWMEEMLETDRAVAAVKTENISTKLEIKEEDVL